MLLRTTLLAAAFAVFAAAPAAAQVPAARSLDALQPCYVAATELQRESVPVVGHNFTALALIDIYLDDISATPAGQQPKADYLGSFTGSVLAPFIDEGQRTFTLRAVEHDAQANSAVVTSKVTRLSVEQSPERAATSDRVRFRGRGFTNKLLPVYMHYIFAGKSKKTVEVGLPTGDCGLFSVKRKQFPFKKSPQVGVWTIQFDQESTYNPKANPRVPLTIKVKRVVKPRSTR
jgi:hypothetical protein